MSIRSPELPSDCRFDIVSFRSSFQHELFASKLKLSRRGSRKMIVKTSKVLVSIVAACYLCLCFCRAQSENRIRSRNSAEWRPRTRSTVCEPRYCKLPDCYCAGKTGPGELRNYEIPQMVMLTFDDSVNEQVSGYYKRLLSDGRLNPNGCPISMTFYLSHNWTDYDMVRDLYRAGHEIASHSVTHRLPQSWWTHASLKDWHREIDGQRQNIVRKAGVPESDVRGMRVPFLELGGDKQFRMMADTDLLYDASFMTGPYDEGGAWPFTLDYPPNWRYCTNNNCPKSSFPGIWELPMNRWIGPDGKACAMVDACQTQPVDKADAVGYMWYNFNRFYRGNRAPFGIHLHAVWFDKDDTYLEALRAFLDALAEMDDVYLVSASDVIEWMRNPTPVSEIDGFLPWRRTCQNTRARPAKTLPAAAANISTTTAPTTKFAPPTTSTAPTTSTTSISATTTTTTTTTSLPTTTPKPRLLRRPEQKAVKAKPDKQPKLYPNLQQGEKRRPSPLRPLWLLPRQHLRPGEGKGQRAPDEVHVRVETARRNDAKVYEAPALIQVQKQRYYGRGVLEQPEQSSDARPERRPQTKKSPPAVGDQIPVARRGNIPFEADVRNDQSPTGTDQQSAAASKRTRQQTQNDAKPPQDAGKEPDMTAREEKAQTRYAHGSAREAAAAAEKAVLKPSSSEAVRSRTTVLAIGLTAVAILSWPPVV